MKSDVHRPVDLRAFLICVVLSMIWGFQQTAIKASAPDIGPLMQVALRSGGAAFLLWCANRFWLREKWNMNVKFTDALKVGLGFAGEFFFVALGLQYTNASHISVLLYTAPFFAAIGLSIKLPEERLSAIQWAGLVTAFTGIATAFLLPVFLSGSAVPEGKMWLLGDFFGLMSGFCWGLTTISMRATTMNEAPASQMLASSPRASRCSCPARSSSDRRTSGSRPSCSRPWASRPSSWRSRATSSGVSSSSSIWRQGSGSSSS